MPDSVKRGAPSSSPSAKLGTTANAVLSVGLSPQDDMMLWVGGAAEANSAAFRFLIPMVVAQSERRSDRLWPGFLIAQLGV